MSAGAAGFIALGTASETGPGGEGWAYAQAGTSDAEGGGACIASRRERASVARGAVVGLGKRVVLDLGFKAEGGASGRVGDGRAELFGTAVASLGELLAISMAGHRGAATVACVTCRAGTADRVA